MPTTDPAPVAAPPPPSTTFGPAPSPPHRTSLPSRHKILRSAANFRRALICLHNGTSYSGPLIRPAPTRTVNVSMLPTPEEYEALAAELTRIARFLSFPSLPTTIRNRLSVRIRTAFNTTSGIYNQFYARYNELAAILDYGIPDSPPSPPGTLQLPAGLPSVTMIADNLAALPVSFDDVRISNNNFSVVTRDPVILRSRNFGRFRITCRYENYVSGGGIGMAFSLEPLSPFRPSRGGYTNPHPHIRDASICLGEGREHVDRALRSGRILDALDLVVSVLNNYSHRSPFVHIEYWPLFGALPNSLPEGVEVSPTEQSRCASCSTYFHAYNLNSNNRCRACAGSSFVPAISPPPDASPYPASSDDDEDEEDNAVYEYCVECSDAYEQGELRRDDEGELLCNNCGTWCEECGAMHLA